jgi:hypothetical protein
MLFGLFQRKPPENNEPRPDVSEVPCCDASDPYNGAAPLAYANSRSYLRDNAYLITCPPRCGSTMLVTMLRSHPDILSYGEVFGHKVISGLTGRYAELVERDPTVMTRLLDIRGEVPVHFLYKYILDPQGRSVVGLKFKFDEMMLDEYASVVEAIRRDTDIKIIVLWRENLLARHLSHLVVSKVTGVTMLRSSDADLDVPPIRIDIQALLSDIELQQARLLRFRSLFDHHRMLNITYEGLLADPTTESRRLTDFLGVREHRMQPGTKKNIRRPLREAIANFEDICNALQGTEHERFCGLGDS